MAKSDALPTGVWGMIGHSFETVFRNFLVFFGATIGFLLVLAVIDGLFRVFFGEVIFDPSLFLVAGIAYVVYVIISFVAGLLLTLTTVYLSVKFLSGKKVGIGEAIKFAFKNFWNGVKIAVRILLYVLVPVLLMVVSVGGFALLNTFLGQDAGAALKVGNLIFGLIGVVSVLWIIARSIKVIFCYFIFVEEGGNAKEVVQKSVKTVTGKWWRVFGSYLLGGLVFGLLFFAAGMLLAAVGLGNSLAFVTESSVTQFGGMLLVYSVIALVLAGILSYLLTVFQNLLYKKYKA